MDLKIKIKNILFFLYPKLKRYAPFSFNLIKKVLFYFPGTAKKIRRILVKGQIAIGRNVKIPLHIIKQKPTLAPLETPQKRIIFLYIDFTHNQPSFHGLVRVVANLAQHLTINKENLVLVKINPETLNIEPLTKTEIEYFSDNFNLNIETFSSKFLELDAFNDLLYSLKFSPVTHWLLNAEVPYHTHHNNPVTSRLIKCARDNELKIGTLFYDNIPFYDIANKHNAEIHARYLSDISLSDIIWPISPYCHRVLQDYLKNYEDLNQLQMPRIITNTLPEEYQGIRESFNFSLKEKYILCIGTICTRKNQLTLVKAFNKFCNAHPNEGWRLAIIGMRGDQGYYKKTVSQAKGNSFIEFHTNLKDEDIEVFFEKAAFTVFASKIEGYGLPIVESLYKLRPCICANFGPMAEIAQQGGCVPIDVNNDEEIFRAIERLAFDKNFYDEKISEIKTRPSKSWPQYIKQMLQNMSEIHTAKCNTTFYIWVDATVETRINSGIQRVTRQICRSLMKIGCPVVPIKWDTETACITLANESDLEHLEKWNGPDKKGWLRNFPPACFNEPIVYLCSDLPLNRSLEIQREVIDYFKDKNAHCCSIFYDTIPIIMKDIYSESFTQAMRDYIILLDRMDQIFSISESTNQHLYDVMNKSAIRGLALEQRLITLPLAEEFSSISRRNILEPSSEKPCSILCVSTVEPRKNHLTLLKAFLEAEKKSSRELKLTLVGSSHTFDTTLKAKTEHLIAQSKNIKWLEDADDTQLHDCYQKADFTVYPSVLEGFGLPIVESLWFGRPCICANFGQMAELARHGGCLDVDIRSPKALENAILTLSNSQETYQNLASQINKRYFKTWEQYASELLSHTKDRTAQKYRKEPILKHFLNNRPEFLPERPILSVCITTYNRKPWLKLNIKNTLMLCSGLGNKFELIVCDNCSGGGIDDIIVKYRNHPQISIYRNSANIGMLNNLAQTVSFANGEYIWLIGDDDLIHKGALENILHIIKTENPTLINLNYNVNGAEAPKTVANVSTYLENSQNYSLNASSKAAPIKEISSNNENFYTAIYSFITKRAFAWRIFNQDTSGSPFSSMQTCVPSSKYVLSKMMEEKGYWLSEPAITVNINVSWREHLSIWLLERIPEVYDLAELNGISHQDVSYWRNHTFKHSIAYLDSVSEFEKENNGYTFNYARFLRRNRELESFSENLPEIKKQFIYLKEYNGCATCISNSEFDRISSFST